MTISCCLFTDIVELFVPLFAVPISDPDMVTSDQIYIELKNRDRSTPNVS
jgi:hypothetical protein